MKNPMINLEYLNLGYNPLGNNALISLGATEAFPNLKELWLEKCDFSGKEPLETFLNGKLAQ